VITFYDDDSPSVNRMLIYLYTNDYPDDEIPPSQRPATESGSRTSPYLCELMSTLAVSAEPRDDASRPAENEVSNNAGVFALADKYDLPRLKDLAKTRFITQISSCSQEQMSTVIRTVFETTSPTDRGLKDVIIRICAVDIDYALNHPPILVDIEKQPSLSFGILSKRRELDKKTLEQASAREAILRADLEKTKAELHKALDLKSLAVIKDDASFSARSKEINQKDDQIHGLTQEKNAALNRESKAIKEKNAALDAKNKAILQKDAAILIKSQLIQDKDTALHRASKAIGAKNGIINEKNQAIQEKNAALTRESKAINAKNAALDAKTTALAQKDFAIKQRNDVIRERDVALNMNANFIERLDYFLDKAEDWDECRTCGLDFDSRIERVLDGGPFKLLLRCAVCDCKHDIGAGIKTKKR